MDVLGNRDRMTEMSFQKKVTKFSGTGGFDF